MAAAIMGRFIEAVALFLVVSSATFALVRLAPGDPAALIYGPNAAPSDLAQVGQRWGLDAPLASQYLLWLANTLHGDFGRSYVDGRPVLAVVAERVPATLALTVSSLLVASIGGTLLGLFAAWRPASLLDKIVRVTTATIYSTPPFWLGILLILVLSVTLGWLPAGGAARPSGSPGLADSFRHLLLPVITLGARDAARFARVARASALDVAGRDFVRMAVAKGLRPSTIATVHILRNALLPVLALQGVAIPGLLSGAVVIETIFSWPGMGRLAIESALQRNYPVVIGEVVVVAALAFCGSIFADLACKAADPRTRTGPRTT